MPVIPFIPAALSVGASIIGSNAQRGAARTAAAGQQAVATQNNALALDMYNRNEARLNPFITGGLNAFNAQQDLLGLGADPGAQDAAFQNFRNSTGYQFQMDQGLGQVDARNAAGNIRLSGGAQKALQDRATQLANGSFGQYYNMLNGQSNIGYGAASAAGGIGQGYVNQVSNNNQNAADASSNAALYNGNVNSSLINSLGQIAGNAFGQSSYGTQAKPQQALGTPIWGNSGVLI